MSGVNRGVHLTSKLLARVVSARLLGRWVSKEMTVKRIRDEIA